MPGGYSGRAVRPIALRQVMEIARACPDVPVSGMGGVENAEDAAQFFLVGASTVQVCTAAMLQGYAMIEGLCEGLLEFMKKHELQTVDELVGKSLPYFSTHADLVERQREARREKAAPPAATRCGAATSPARPRRWSPIDPTGRSALAVRARSASPYRPTCARSCSCSASWPSPAPRGSASLRCA